MQNNCCRKQLLLVFLLFLGAISFAQQQVRGLIMDSVTKQPLPFATIESDDQKTAAIAGIGGRFILLLSPHHTHINVSYIGHRSKTISIDVLKNNDTIWLAPVHTDLNEVIIRPQEEKIKRIINTAIKNKPLHNPELYERYECAIYYKMKADLLPFGKDPNDSSAYNSTTEVNAQPETDKRRKEGKPNDSVFKSFITNQHIFIGETYTKRLYKKPQQVQENILASRFSGLKKTYFSNIVTDVLPFHIYTNYISFNGKEYIHPIAKGWQQRYQFQLADEINIGNDTVFMLTFRPKTNTAFNSLTGAVYINSDGYAISHFISSTGDSTTNREARFEQIYAQVNGRWFPKELNYELTVRKFISPYKQLKWNGHSVIDSISFDKKGNNFFDKAHPVKFDDSIDLRTEAEWQHFRKDSITLKEINTYQFIDSLSQKHDIEKIVTGIGGLNTGLFSVGKIDVDVNRIIATNDYEKLRLGVGVYTNDKVSRYYSIGGWAGYGFKDKVWKYGAAATVFPGGTKETWAQFSYQKNYRNPGQVQIHQELARTGFRNWLLGQVDQFEEYALTGNFRKGYWEIKAEAGKQKVEPLYATSFQVNNKQLSTFTRYEGSIGLRYAYREKRVPVFKYYVPYKTKYPIAYLLLSTGRVTSIDYVANYIRSLAAVTYSIHNNRWGKDQFQLEGGLLHVLDEQPLARSFLMAGNGFRIKNTWNYYAWGGFITMRPYDFYSDRYISLLYKHDFDGYLWDEKISKPFISVAHNMVYGSIEKKSRMANAGISSLTNGYHESGILVNQLLRVNLGFSDMYFTAGAFYHWTKKFDWNGNCTWVAGISAGF